MGTRMLMGRRFADRIKLLSSLLEMRSLRTRPWRSCWEWSEVMTEVLIPRLKTLCEMDEVPGNRWPLQESLTLLAGGGLDCMER
eukprot:765674-Hanusia_phi.AAC.3